MPEEHPKGKRGLSGGLILRIDPGQRAAICRDGHILGFVGVTCFRGRQARVIFQGFEGLGIYREQVLTEALRCPVRPLDEPGDSFTVEEEIEALRHEFAEGQAVATA